MVFLPSESRYIFMSAEFDLVRLVILVHGETIGQKGTVFL